VAVEFTARVVTARPVSAKAPIPGVRHVVAVYACKGGVGKSTISTNIAVALAKAGARVGLLDADVHGPNIPLMMGVEGRAEVSENNRITPLVGHGVKVMSIALVMQENAPKIWRGPMVHGAIQQLLRDTEWGELDYLIVDLPPGTGDAQLTVIQTVPLSGVIFVSTPQAVSLLDGNKGIGMFAKLNVPMLGLVENMSGFRCGHCQEVTPIFSAGGGETEARRQNIPFLGAIPLDPEIVVGGDTGRPVVMGHPESESARLLTRVAERVAAKPISSQIHLQ
jgi:ATP-binding protein involved in chromosome partitioning